ncbi:GTP-binding protein [Metamycoplasma subdolum]|uniref:Probable GTP-binding protein EngB n=1 Tax=Metamycoplasma subdolum TaxID=92407 RepID=A0A3M0A1X1_9BACT|nr:ribosome biogenesis GTP-binding protein YihA/YsxC [Metamycoplasma subdolum]RMA77429.1 GTP-binding protein [Metamycoplasma subdolum]WPB50395.1 ribosome biogenesis GTP-binding protein YihA/YsxC [Metamycoplasma subdolum]
MWKYLKSAQDQNSWFQHEGEEIVFWGRSNVGKSSLINSLAESKVAKTSSTPGRTRLINYFETTNKKIVVDLPGYGFAKMSKKDQDKISSIIDLYFSSSSNQKTVCLLIDAKIGFLPIDLEMIEYLNQKNIHFDIIITKIDKANQAQMHKVKKQALTFSININVFLVSSTKKKGISDILEFFKL